MGPSGASYPRSPSFGWAAQYRVGTAGVATLRFEGGPWGPVGVGLQVLLWIVLARALVERRGVVRPWIRAAVRRWRRRRSEPDTIPGLSNEPTGELTGVDEVGR